MTNWNEPATERSVASTCASRDDRARRERPHPHPGQELARLSGLRQTQDAGEDHAGGLLATLKQQGLKASPADKLATLAEQAGKPASQLLLAVMPDRAR